MRIGFAPEAQAQLDLLSDKERTGVLRKIKEVVLNRSLAKPLTGRLAGCCRVTFGRIRCVVRLAEGDAVALVLVVAPRKQGARTDPYERAVAFMNSNSEAMERLLGQYVRAFIEETAQRMQSAKQRLNPGKRRKE